LVRSAETDMKQQSIRKPVAGLAVMIATVFSASAILAADLTGDWTIESSIGDTPIMVHCTLIQSNDTLSGSCTPVMADPMPSELTGTVSDSGAEWGYDVVFNGNPGHVGFVAEAVSEDSMSGALDLSGTPTRFTARRVSSE
jgi:hypothetical protein